MLLRPGGIVFHLRIPGLLLQLFDLLNDVALSMKVDRQTETTEQRNYYESNSSAIVPTELLQVAVVQVWYCPQGPNAFAKRKHAAGGVLPPLVVFEKVGFRTIQNLAVTCP